MHSTQQESLRRQVQRNCDISDAHHAGLFSICGLALRLRDLYKWRHELSPWQLHNADDILQWIDARESHWSTLEDDDYQSISIAGQSFEPFDTAAINAQLRPHHLFYGAGFGYSLKPTFFLASSVFDGLAGAVPIVKLERELARDLMALPALHQDGCIVLRQETGRAALWDHIQYVRKSGRQPLRFALKQLGIASDDGGIIPAHLDRVFNAYCRLQIGHEMGEMAETAFDGDVWRRIIRRYPHSPIELSARAVKDLLADCGPNGGLTEMAKTRDGAGIGLYVAFLEGARAALFPEIRPAFDALSLHGDWQPLRQALQEAFERAERWARTLQRLFLEGRAETDPLALEHRLSAFAQQLFKGTGA